MGIASLNPFGALEGLKITGIAVIYGLWSLFYWYQTSTSPSENILFYVFFQICVLCFAAYCCIMRRQFAMSYKWVAFAIAAYVLSKPFEVYDSEFFEITNGLISGHSMKHLIIVFSVFALLIHMLESASDALTRVEERHEQDLSK